MREKEHAPVEYDAYKGMIRAEWAQVRNYPEMASRVHPDWLKSFEHFYRDMGPCPPGCSLQKFIPTTRWQKGNARWA